MQRLRVRFCRGQELKYISHLDIIRLWHRACRRADIPLAYSEGFNPHPRIALAAPLPLGVTSDAELMDITCRRPVSPHFLIQAVNKKLLPGIEISKVFQVAIDQPSLQSLVRQAEYRVTVRTSETKQEIEAAISQLLGRDELPWQHQRDTGIRKYDLRALICDIRLEEFGDGICRLGMLLRCDSGGSGRPEQVALALGFSERPFEIQRTGLILRTV